MLYDKILNLRVKGDVYEKFKKILEKRWKKPSDFLRDKIFELVEENS